MAVQYSYIAEMAPAIRETLFPTISSWNRLEGRPRTANFDRALRAEVRDALWMLTKQWQMGEFDGDDAGSPVFAKLSVETTQLDQYRAAQHAVQDFEENIPLEAKVEQRRLPFDFRNIDGSVNRFGQLLDLRLSMGRYWMRLLEKKNLAIAYRDAFIAEFPIELPNPEDPRDAGICAHPEAWQQVAAVAGRMMDGTKLYAYLKQSPAPHVYDRPGLAAPMGDQIKFNDLETRFTEWFERLFYQPTDENNDAWMPSHLEYQFACSAPQANGAEKVLVAEEYYHGHLDWYNLDIDGQKRLLGDAPDPTPSPIVKTVETVIPAPIGFEGMPNTRWWTFEDQRTNFAFVKPDTVDIGKLLLMEFGLVYANDWFMLPWTLPLGSIARVKGLTITNVFGERLWIEPAGRGNDDDWTRWNMFTLNIRGNTPAPSDQSVLLLPTVPKIQESEPLEKVAFIRDEMANRVWGIETVIPMVTGKGKSGNEAALEYRRYRLRLGLEQNPDNTPVPPGSEAKIRYEVMSSVPENWIPFIPVHLPNNDRQVQLQRAAMPRILEGTLVPIEKVRPRTSLVRQGLDADQPEPFFLHEEEVSRAGAHILQSYQRTRWHGGQVFNWFGVRKVTGRGEGSSGLSFDRIVPR